MITLKNIVDAADCAVARKEYTVTLCTQCADKAHKKYTGEYHQRLISGHSRLSGADLKGKARKYSGWYSRSAEELVRGLTVDRLGFETRHKGRRLLVIGGFRHCCKG